VWRVGWGSEEEFLPYCKRSWEGTGGYGRDWECVGLRGSGGYMGGRCYFTK